MTYNYKNGDFRIFIRKKWKFVFLFTFLAGWASGGFRPINSSHLSRLSLCTIFYPKQCIVIFWYLFWKNFKKVTFSLLQKNSKMTLFCQKLPKIDHFGPKLYCFINAWTVKLHLSCKNCWIISWRDFCDEYDNFISN